MSQRCQVCSTSQGPILILLCGHDPCIRCAMKTYLLKSNRNINDHNYICEMCQQVTILDSNTIQCLYNFYQNNNQSLKNSKIISQNQLRTKLRSGTKKQIPNKIDIQQPQQLQQQQYNFNRQQPQSLNKEKINKIQQVSPFQLRRKISTDSLKQSKYARKNNILVNQQFFEDKQYETKNKNKNQMSSKSASALQNKNIINNLQIKKSKIFQSKNNITTSDEFQDKHNTSKIQDKMQYYGNYNNFKQKKINKNCHLHPNQNMIYYCLYCKISVCSQCALYGTHRGHDMQTIKKAILKIQDIFQKNLEKLDKCIDQDIKKQQQITNKIKSINLQCKKEKIKIQKYFEKFIIFIQNKCHILIEELDQVQKQGIQYLRKSFEDFRISSNKVKDIRDKMKQGINLDNKYIDNNDLYWNQNFEKFMKIKQGKYSNKDFISQALKELQYKNQYISSFFKEKKSNKPQNNIRKQSEQILQKSLQLSDSESFQFIVENHNIKSKKADSKVLNLPKQQIKSLYNFQQINEIDLKKSDEIIDALNDIQDIIQDLKLDTYTYPINKESITQNMLKN